ncbi:hypothetical protein HHX48_13095 [Salinimonas sp. HHU 13199]|uniref:Uncharacterized protein n=1 Tax=Salinimonas profundi TaxID=2729140 RepID=A0ABR8LMU8_9ALTE|nr:hypothetical protein [Salinimonas profundi]MBD3586678.1 hypothetical protein [Salinimonas profundi]
MLCNPLKTHTVTLRGNDAHLGKFDATLQEGRVSVWASPDIIRSHKIISVELEGRVLTCVPTTRLRCTRSFFLSPDCIEVPVKTH